MKPQVSQPSVLFEEVESSFDEVIPTRLEAILRIMKEGAGTAFFDFCKSAESVLLQKIDKMIEQAREAQLIDGKDKMFTIPGSSLTIVLITGRNDMLCNWDRRNNVAAVMYAQGKETWNALYLGFSRTGNLLQAEEKTIKKEDFSQNDWKFVMSLGERIIEKRKNK